MGMTMTQKVIAAHCGAAHVTPGDLVLAHLDMVLGNDITSPVAINEYNRIGCNCVFDREKVSLVLDHFTPNKDIKAAEQAKKVRDFAKANDIPNFFDVGDVGVEHMLLPEKGLVVAGDAVIGADSHTCTYGALGAFSTGVGSTDMAVGMATGKAWLRVPSAIRVVLRGALPKWVCGKDVILHLIGRIGVDGARYRSLEFQGEGVAALSMADRFTIANMAIEAGAKNGIFPVDGQTLAYIKDHSQRTPVIFEADADADYDETVEIDLSVLRPTVSYPHLPSNTRTIDGIAAAAPVKIDQVVIGSCTNGRLEDMEQAAEILRGKRVHPDVRVLIIPATQQIYLDSLERGLLKLFVEAGCAVSTPTCGPCLGGHMGILAEGERCVATTNRNFVGRMGHPKSEVYLASPYIAAASALTGYITAPEKLEKEEGRA